MRRRRVQVGWYCNHDDEPLAEGSHMSGHGKWKKGKWIETFAEPCVRQSLQFLHYREPKTLPHCPIAVPVYIYEEPK